MALQLWLWLLPPLLALVLLALLPQGAHRWLLPQGAHGAAGAAATGSAWCCWRCCHRGAAATGSAPLAAAWDACLRRIRGVHLQPFLCFWKGMKDASGGGQSKRLCTPVCALRVCVCVQHLPLCFLHCPARSRCPCAAGGHEAWAAALPYATQRHGRGGFSVLLVRGASQEGCITGGVHHREGASQAGCITGRVHHRQGASQEGWVEPGGRGGGATVEVCVCVCVWCVGACVCVCWVRTCGGGCLVAWRTPDWGANQVLTACAR